MKWADVYGDVGNIEVTKKQRIFLTLHDREIETQRRWARHVLLPETALDMAKMLLTTQVDGGKRRSQTTKEFLLEQLPIIGSPWPGVQIRCSTKDIIEVGLAPYLIGKTTRKSHVLLAIEQRTGTLVQGQISILLEPSDWMRLAVALMIVTALAVGDVEAA